MFTHTPVYRIQKACHKQQTKISQHAEICLVGEEGLEPSRIAPPAPKAGAYTNSATRP